MAQVQLGKLLMAEVLLQFQGPGILAHCDVPLGHLNLNTAIAKVIMIYDMIRRVKTSAERKRRSFVFFGRVLLLADATILAEGNVNTTVILHATHNPIILQ